jgi:hypothetical protein
MLKALRQHPLMVGTAEVLLDAARYVTIVLRRRPRGPSGTAPEVDENAGRISGGGVAANHNVVLYCRPAQGPD